MTGKQRALEILESLPDDASWDDVLEAFAWKASPSGADEGKDFCERCGEFGEGKLLWMFHQGQLPRKEFYCRRCIRIMRIYAAIAFSLLGSLVTGFFVFAWWNGAFH